MLPQTHNYLSKEATGYPSDPTGLLGYNCRHSFHPFWEGLSEPTAWPKEPEPKTVNGRTYTYYQATQEQRRREREIRALKREESALSAAGLTDQAKEKRALIQARTAEYEDFSRDVEIRPKNERLRVCEDGSALTSDVKRGIINIEIDDFTPCLRDNNTGEFVKTCVEQVTNRTELRQFSKKNGWNVDWAKMPADGDVFSLRVNGSKEIEGLVGIRSDTEAGCVYLHWASTAPHNNKQLNNGNQKYSGVGGHLFAIAAEESIKRGYDGYMYGFASNEKVLEHYCTVFGAEYIGMLHKYHFVIDEMNARKLMEVYSYDRE